MSVTPPTDPPAEPPRRRLPERRPVDRTVSPVPPVPVVPTSVISRFGARVLDPQTAVQVPGTRLSPTVYLAGSLLVRGLPGGRAGQTFERMQKVAGLMPEAIQLSISRRDLALAEQFGTDQLGDLFERTWTTRILLSRPDPTPAPPPDAWTVLQQLRSLDAELAGEMSLDHLLTASTDWTGVGGMWGGVGGMWGGVGGMWGGVAQGLAGYGSPGFGGRTPVVWSAPDPRASAPILERPPVVAMLDTGVGDHPWFRDPAGSTEHVSAGGQTIGVVFAQNHDPEYTGVVSDPINGLIDREAGHGTFIAGIVRQRCPQAHLLTIPVMPADGAVAEQEVLIALNQLLKLHVEAQRSGSANMVDVLNLSMGYYHETADDAGAAAPLAAVLQAYGEHGIAVVAAAGNEATSAPFFPAALAPTMTAGVPMISVGALNPDGRTVALFSNHGSWITTHAPGASIVSTVPVTLTGAQGRGIAVQREDPLPRTTVDPDDYTSGFAIWSGSSFAAPWIAGEVAAAIAAASDLRTVDQGSAVDRGRAAVEAVLGARSTAFDAARKQGL